MLDLGATAKALAADRAAAAIEAAVGGGVLVNLGGDIQVSGDPPPGGWLVGIANDVGFRRQRRQHPGRSGGHDPRRRPGHVEPARPGLARDGVDLHHMIHPVTGLPADSCWRTVSVAAANCVDANIASTGRDPARRAGARMAGRAAPARPAGGS